MSPGSPDLPDTTPVTPAVAGVVWDLGNVLLRWEPAHAVAAGVGEEEARAFLDGFDFHAWNLSCDAGRPWSEALEEVRTTAPRWYDAALAYHRHFAASLTGEIPGSVALLRALHGAGVAQYGLTNWSSELFHGHAPQRYDFLGLLDDIVVSGDVGVAKPDPAVYRVVAERSGIPLERLAFVDDRPDNVEAARALGMRGIVFGEPEQLARELRALCLPV